MPSIEPTPPTGYNGCTGSGRTAGGPDGAAASVGTISAAGTGTSTTIGGVCNAGAGAGASTVVAAATGAGGAGGGLFFGTFAFFGVVTD
jgi:hypothetical protein